MDVYLDQLSRVVKAHDLRFLRYVITDGAYSTQKFVTGVRALELHQIGKLRADAHRRYLYQGPKRPGPGRQKTYDGKVTWNVHISSRIGTPAARCAISGKTTSSTPIGAG